MPLTIKDFEVSDAVVERFFTKMSGNSWSACWIFSAVNGEGYGQIDNGFTMLRAHRVAYQLAFGSIPEGKVLDHLCFNTACVNPLHLDPKTNEENAKRRKSHFYPKPIVVRIKVIHFQNSLLDKVSFCGKGKRNLMTRIEQVTCVPCKNRYDEAVQIGHTGLTA